MQYVNIPCCKVCSMTFYFALLNLRITDIFRYHKGIVIKLLVRLHIFYHAFYLREKTSYTSIIIFF